MPLIEQLIPNPRQEIAAIIAEANAPKKSSKKKEIPPYPEVSWRAPDPSTWPSLKGVKRIAVDTETYDKDLKLLGPGPRRGAYIVGMSMAIQGGPKFYFPVRHAGGDNLDCDQVFNYARAELNNYEGEVVGANIGYELDFLANEGVTFKNAKRFYDVLIAEPIINDSGKGYYSLGSLTEKYLKEPKDETVLRAAIRAMGLNIDTDNDKRNNTTVKGNLWQLPGRYVGAYGESDADQPLRILDHQLAIMEQQELLDVFALESELAPLLIAMRRRGLRVDLDRCERIQRKLVALRDTYHREARHLAGHDLELMAAETFAQDLIDLGVPVPRTPKTGKPSVTKESGLFEDYDHIPLVKAIGQARQLNTILNTFVAPVFKHHINGRVHPTYNQMVGDEKGARTGRLSCSNPNIQNQPKRSDFAPLIRSMYLPEEGEEWGRLDYSQIEYRFLAAYGRGPSAAAARAAYRNDPKTDFHKMCATAAGKDPEDDKIRDRVKNINFGKVYGAGPPKLAKLIQCSIEEAREFSAWYDTALPFVKVTFNEAMKTANNQGYVRTILKRRSRFDTWEPRERRYDIEVKDLPYWQAKEVYGPNLKRAKTYSALNRILQGSAADLMKLALRNAYRDGVYGVMGVPLVNVHDEFGMSKPRTKAGDEAMAHLKECMENALKLSIPIMADMKISDDWGQASVKKPFDFDALVAA